MISRKHDSTTLEGSYGKLNNKTVRLTKAAQAKVERNAKGKAVKAESVGQRIAEMRNRADMTQMHLSRIVGRGRSAVAQWERDDAAPPLEIFELMAEHFKTRPEYLAFGVTSEPTVVLPDPETLGYVLVPEIQFGDRMEDVHSLPDQTWGVSTTWLRNELQVTNLQTLGVFKVEADSGPYQFGDRVIVDKSATRASPPGTFLIWDGYGPSINSVAVLPGGSERKMIAKISGALGNYETEVDKIKIIGRVRGVWKKA